MATIYIDGKAYQVDAGDNLLKACIKQGIDIPYFCYHPALGSVGSCRLCAIKRFRDADDKKGRIVMSCMEPVTDGMYISVEDEEVKDFRASIIESLMTNHPHDCPVCDEAGECHLQDMTLMTGHNYRRFEYRKRTYKNQDLGPYINHEMNRCIQCYRCVRFYSEYAGGKDFGVFGAHNALYFGRFEDGKLESEFSGNLIEVCPTGVFTDKTLKKHYARKWDLTYAPSVCTKCSVGCNTIVGERYGLVRRVLNRYNKDVNGYFLCDRGRFGYEFINDNEKRIRKPFLNKNELTIEEAINKAVSMISKNSIAIGSSAASIEANYSLRKLVGKENFFAGVSAQELKLLKQILNIYKDKKIHIASLLETENAEGVLILGEDILKTAPRLALSVRQAVKNKPMVVAQRLNIPEWNDKAVKTALANDKGPIYIATPEVTGIDDVATTYRADTESTVRFASTILALVNKTTLPAGISKEEQTLAEDVVKQFSTCSSVVIISGTTAGEKVIELAAALTKAFTGDDRKSAIHLVVPEGNSIASGILSEKSIEDALQAVEKGEADTLLVLENNLFEKVSKDKLEAALPKLKNLIVLDHTSSELSTKANLVLSVGTFAESEGTVVNAEGRMQRYFSALPALYGVRQAWKWINDIYAQKSGTNTLSFDGLIKEISLSVPEFVKITEVAPAADFRLLNMKIPRQTPRFSGRTSMMSHVNVSEMQPPKDENSALAYTMEGTKAIPPQELTAYYWTPGWNSNQASNRYLSDLNNVLKGREPGVRIFE